MDVVDIRISHLKHKVEINKRVQDTPISKKRYKLQDFSKRIVFVTVDEAATNVSVVCRKYYMDVLTSEILYSSTFKSVRSTESHI